MLCKNASASECLSVSVKAATTKLFHGLPLQGLKLISILFTLGGCCTQEEKEKGKKKRCISSCLLVEKVPCRLFPDQIFPPPLAGYCVGAFISVHMHSC